MYLDMYEQLVFAMWPSFRRLTMFGLDYVLVFDKTDVGRQRGRTLAAVRPRRVCI